MSRLSRLPRTGSRCVTVLRTIAGRRRRARTDRLHQLLVQFHQLVSRDHGGRQPSAARIGNRRAGSGEKIRIGFSAPAADHGWMGSITKSAVAEAAKHSATSS